MVKSLLTTSLVATAPACAYYFMQSARDGGDMQVGTKNYRHKEVEIDLATPLNKDNAIIQGLLSYNGAQLAVPTMSELSDGSSAGRSGWKQHLIEPTAEECPSGGYDGRHKLEDQAWLADSTGEKTTDEGVKYIVGTVDITQGGNNSTGPQHSKMKWTNVQFPGSGLGAASGTQVAVFATVQPGGTGKWSAIRIKNADSQGFRMVLQAPYMQEAENWSDSIRAHWLGTEKIGYLAIPVGSGNINGHQYSVEMIEGVTHNKTKVTSLTNKGSTIPDALVFGQIQTCEGMHPSTLRLKAGKKILIRETGPKCGLQDKEHGKPEQVAIMQIAPNAGGGGGAGASADAEDEQDEDEDDAEDAEESSSF